MTHALDCLGDGSLISRLARDAISTMFWKVGRLNAWIGCGQLSMTSRVIY